MSLPNVDLIRIAEEVRAYYKSKNYYTVLVADLPDKYSFFWRYPNEPNSKTWPKT